MALTAALVAVAAAHGAAWFIVTGRIADQVPGFVARAAVDGWQVETGQLRRTGWPWAATVEVLDVVATRPLGGTLLRWTAAQLDLTVAPQAPGELRIEAIGPQSLLLGSGPAIQMTAATAMLSLPLAGGPLDLQVRDLSATAQNGREVRVGAMQGRFDTLAAAGHAEGITLLPPLPPPFEQGASVSARLLASQPFPAAATPAQSAAAWQAAAGRVEVPEFSVSWGALRAEGTGSGGLDARLQPQGQATLRTQGASLVLDAAVRGGWAPPGPASAARAVLGLLSLASGGGPVVLPVVLQDRTLTVAQFPLVRLPVFDWGSVDWNSP